MDKCKLFIGGLLSTAILFSPSISYAKTKFSGLNLTPYAGVDVGIQHFEFEPGYGDNLFKNELPVGNLFAGVKFNDYFGIEGGYESTLEGKRNSTIYGGNTVLGNVLLSTGPTAMEYIKCSSKVKISGWHLGITGYSPIYLDESSSLSILGYFGIKHTNVKLIRNLLESKGVGDPAEIDLDTTVLGTNNKKPLLRFSAGIEYFFNKHIGLRALIGWEDTSSLQPTDGVNKIAKLKDSTLYSIGIILK
ncbi:MAG: outer membrane beta-barrel protein [Gammaproteobacteria bacterium]